MYNNDLEKLNPYALNRLNSNRIFFLITFITNEKPDLDHNNVVYTQVIHMVNITKICVKNRFKSSKCL